MKIAIHQPRVSYYVGGGERIPLDQARYLSKAGNDITIITTKTNKKSPLFKRFIRNNPLIKIKEFALSKKLKSIYKKDPGQNRFRTDSESIEFGSLTRDYYRRNPFDLVATHYTVDALGIPKNQKVVLHLHGCPNHRRQIDKKSLIRSNSLAAVAKYVGNFWKDMYKINSAIKTIYNGVDDKYFHPIELPLKYDILFVGRIIRIKGIDNLLRAIKQIINHKSDLKAAIVGKGPERIRLINLAKRLNIMANIDWVEAVDDKNLIRLYNSSKIGVFPSTAKEGVLTTMLEGAACGMAVITTRCCGMPEFVIHNKNGILVKPNDSYQLAVAIQKLLGNEKLRKQIGKNARIDICKKWTWEKRSRELELSYKSWAKK